MRIIEEKDKMIVTGNDVQYFFISIGMFILIFSIIFLDMQNRINGIILGAAISVIASLIPGTSIIADRKTQKISNKNFDDIEPTTDICMVL